MSRWVVRVCAAVGWLDFVDRNVLDSYLARPASPDELEPAGSWQNEHGVPNLTPWVWATTGLCAVVVVLLAVGSPMLTGRTSLSAVESPLASEATPALQPVPAPRSPVIAPIFPPSTVDTAPWPSPASTDGLPAASPPSVPPSTPRVAPIEPESPRGPSAPAAPAVPSEASLEPPAARQPPVPENEQAEHDLEVALDRLGEVTRVARVRSSAVSAPDWGAAQGSATGESRRIGMAAAVRIGERIQPVWVELELEPGSGATLRLQETSSKPVIIGNWRSWAAARLELGDSLIRWYRRQLVIPEPPRSDQWPTPPARPQSSNAYEIPAFGGRK